MRELLQLNFDNLPRVEPPRFEFQNEWGKFRVDGFGAHCVWVDAMIAGGGVLPCNVFGSMEVGLDFGLCWSSEHPDFFGFGVQPGRLSENKAAASVLAALLPHAEILAGLARERAKQERQRGYLKAKERVRQLEALLDAARHNLKQMEEERANG